MFLGRLMVEQLAVNQPEKSTASSTLAPGAKFFVSLAQWQSLKLLT
jgi:hypothetical protein